METKLPNADQEYSRSTTNHKNRDNFGSGVASFRTSDKRVDIETVKNGVSSVVKEPKKVMKMKDRYVRNMIGSESKREMGLGLNSIKSEDENFLKVLSKSRVNKVMGENMDKISIKGGSDKLGVEKRGKGSKKNKVDSPELVLKIGLDMCSKRGDVIGAIQLFDLAQREGIKMGQYHYAVILYLCSSATTGVVQPAKSGSGSRSLSLVDYSTESESSEDLSKFGVTGKRNFGTSDLNMQVPRNGLPVESGDIHGSSDNQKLNIDSSHVAVAKGGKEKTNQFSNGSIELSPQTLTGLIHMIKGDDDGSSNLKYVSGGRKDHEILVSEDVKKFARERGFEIYEKMLLEKVPMNEATLTSVARMAMSMGNGDLAFDMVKQMKALGINPRLRSYGPALSVFSNNGDIEKAFIVEEHMLEHGVYPEEPELEALLKVSIEASRGDKVYYLLHKLRTSVRKVLPSTADLIEKWFRSKVASTVGRRKWDQSLIMEANVNGGGGWHGQGWLGKGKWTVSRTFIGADGLCKFCGEKLVTIDLDPTETENFAESVATIARKREKHKSFEKFQKWLDYYGPFEAVVDGANVGLYSQNRFRPPKVNAIVNGIRQMLPSKKWPLIVLHNRRITGDKMDEPVNKALIEKWKNADALYATPTGSNDDWYWLYAAIKCKSLLVTNDEMRDHLFQTLGNDFFPKWKERHQVRFSFSDIGPVFHMPPPCSVVIQESEKGRWHIPLVSERDSEEERTWLCITRAKSRMTRQDMASTNEELPSPRCKKGNTSSDTQTETRVKLPLFKRGNHESIKQPAQELFGSLREILSSPTFDNRDTILQQIDAAEKLGCCIIDFQI